MNDTTFHDDDESVTSEQRFSEQQPCPVCGGYPSLPQHTGERCWGYYSQDGEIAFCTREELAGELEQVGDSGAYPHWLSEECGCGVQHNITPLRARAPQTSRASNGSTPARRVRRMEYELLLPDGTLAGIHHRDEYEITWDDGTVTHEKRIWWSHHRERAKDRHGRPIPKMPLYNIHKVAQAAKGSLVYVTEGEKACDALRERGLLAVGTVTGAETIPCDDSLRALRRYEIALWPDNDAVGHDHMRRIAERLSALRVAPVRWVNWTDAPPKGDAADYFADATQATETLAALLGDDEAPFAPAADDAQGDLIRTADTSETLTGSIISYNSLNSYPPTPDLTTNPMFHGVAGDFVRLVAPHTESDPVSLLVQFLAAIGNAAGRHAYFVAEGSRHYPNLYVVIVGASGRSRKGSSSKHALNRIGASDALWHADHTREGLTSGEGLTHTVRNVPDGDPALDHEPMLRDKRLFVLESEFGSVLMNMARDGNTLSARLRQGWDGVPLGNMTKNNGERSTGHHISIVGHITGDELLRDLTQTEAANGFGNRFAWFAVKRSQVLPEGGQAHALDYKALDAQITQALTFAETDREVRRAPALKEQWAEAYARLTQEQMGLLGALTARAEAQVMRFALVYALLDCSAVIEQEHLDAALALWDYSEQSVKAIFGDSLGDPLADTVLGLLRAAKPDGLTLTALSEGLGKNTPAARLHGALLRLARAGLARATQEKKARGRPTQTWWAI